MKIKSLDAREVLDSRGMWTVGVRMVLADGAYAVDSVPQGKSTGFHEALSLPAAQAVRNINKVIAPKLRGKNFASQTALDDFLIRLDGAPNKKKLGANAILAASMAFLRASAKVKKVPLWKHVNDVYLHEGKSRSGDPVKPGAPRLFMNVVNGGLHAGNNLHFQEYLIIPKTKSVKASVEIGTTLYHALGAMLARTKGKVATNIGDEGGYAPDFKDDLEPFRILQKIAKQLRLGKAIDFGLDAAATDARLSKEDLMHFYKKFTTAVRPLYLEDPFPEEQFEDFAVLTEKYGKETWIAGDDLTTTNVRRMERADAEESVNAVIIKPNQIGSVSEALDAVRAARQYGWKVVASHRSGETNDSFIADFAWGVRADGIKLGAPARGERVAKYNRLIEIEHEAR
ncbi:MAG TPA: enolase C-terminal domain-like protein [Candidatus Paceibacterota bacterium]|nr:enolase C-terminal domain-like protein [Candidatus Paceibacterota bacterium]